MCPTVRACMSSMSREEKKNLSKKVKSLDYTYAFKYFDSFHLF